MSLRNDCPALANFLGSWFPDADLDEMDDLDVVARFRSVSSDSQIQAIRAELAVALGDVNRYWIDVGREANRYFENPLEAEEWLRGLVRALG